MRPAAAAARRGARGGVRRKPAGVPRGAGAQVDPRPIVPRVARGLQRPPPAAAPHPPPGGLRASAAWCGAPRPRGRASRFGAPCAGGLQGLFATFTPSLGGYVALARHVCIAVSITRQIACRCCSRGREAGCRFHCSDSDGRGTLRWTHPRRSYVRGYARPFEQCLGQSFDDATECRDRQVGTRAGLAHMAQGEARHLSLGSYRTRCDGDVHTAANSVSLPTPEPEHEFGFHREPPGSVSGCRAGASSGGFGPVPVIPPPLCVRAIASHVFPPLLAREEPRATADASHAPQYVLRCGQGPGPAGQLRSRLVDEHRKRRRRESGHRRRLGRRRRPGEARPSQ